MKAKTAAIGAVIVSVISTASPRLLAECFGAGLGQPAQTADQPFSRVPLPRFDAGIRGLGGSDESAAAAGALRKGYGPMTMRY